MNDVISLHKADLAAGHKKLSTLQPQSPEWWDVKHKMSKYEIAFAQSANMANDMVSRNLTGGKNSISVKDYMEATKIAHLEFYKHLTEPYRVHKDQFRDGSKKAKEDKTITNIDNEIEL